MKKHTVILALSTLLLLAAASCASTPKALPPASSPPPAESTTPTVSAPEIPRQQPETPQQQQQAGSIILEGAGTHTVVWRDTLSNIAKRYYGAQNGYYYGLIMLASNITNPDIIVSGTQLIIPDLQRNLANSGARARLKSYSLEIAYLLAGKGDMRNGRNMRALAESL
jgi:Tfp pilus assembly protein FimV